MSFVPDKIVERRRKDGVSYTAFEFFLKYCEHADQETGYTFANENTCAEAFGIRTDNAKKYDAELQTKGWIEIVISGGRTVRKLNAGWIPRKRRRNVQKVKAQVKDEILKFRDAFTKILNFRESSYTLGNLPILKENLLNFRNAYKEYIDQPINQQIDQLFDQIENAERQAARVAETAPIKLPDSDEGNFSAQTRTTHEKPEKLPPDFSTSADMRDWAARNAEDVDIHAETLRFVNYWSRIALRKNVRTKDQWLATWENWMLDKQAEINENKRRSEVWRVQKEKENQQNGNGHKPTAAQLIANRSYRRGASGNG